MEKWAPNYLIEQWDNSGLQIGNPEQKINKILVALDLDKRVLNKALELGANMIITHHPIIFSPLKSINKLNYKEGLIYHVIKNNLVVFSAHTNLDMADGGVNDVLAERLGLENTRILKPIYGESLYKLAVFVPHSHRNLLLEKLGDAGAGLIGDYSHCTYNIDGVGTFKPLAGANPYLGKVNQLERVEEARIETLVQEKDLNKVIRAIIQAHPYEEVAYDIYKLKNKGKEFGYGKIGEIKERPLEEYIEIVKKELDLEHIIVYGDSKRMVKKVAVCGGSGANFIKDAAMKGADIYITGDIKYHDAQHGDEMGLTILDAGHFHTEKVILAKIKEYLENNINTTIEIQIYKESSPPYIVV